MTYSEPLLLVLLLAFIAGMFLRPSRTIPCCIASLFLLTWPPLDWLFARHLEARYPVRPFDRPPAGAIVVLSGGISPAQWERPFELPNNDTAERCEFGAWLFHKWKTVPVLVAGGSDGLGREPYAVTMKRYLERAGVPPHLIWTEERSHSTFENALFSSQILRGRGIGTIALVVEAQSMLRAEACFRKQGIEVVPAPSSFRYLGEWQTEILPNWRSIRRNEITLHETIGLAWYRWRGWI